MTFVNVRLLHIILLLINIQDENQVILLACVTVDILTTVSYYAIMRATLHVVYVNILLGIMPEI